MLFRKKIAKSCYYCLHGAPLEGESILCCKKGLRSQDKPCRKFRYDPCKRVPPRPKAMDFSQYDNRDFSL